MDISQTTAPRSDQLNFDDVANAHIVVTVTDVKAGTDEQPVEIHTAETPGRPFKPSKSMRRVLVAAWGSEAANYVGRRMDLFGDPDITFGRDRVGGIRIAALSHIDKPMTIPLTVTRGKRAPFTVQPLPDAPPTADPSPEQIAAATSPDELRAMWVNASPETRALITARKAELDGATS